MANWQLTETAQIAATAVNNFATFGVPGTAAAGGIQQCYVSGSADFYIDFDTPAAATRSLLVKGGQPPVRFDFKGGSVQKVHVVAVTTATVYVLGVRN